MTRGTNQSQSSELSEEPTGLRSRIRASELSLSGLPWTLGGEMEMPNMGTVLGEHRSASLRRRDVGADLEPA
jgi:hypothetical protein